jgi:hypothetical protein
MDGRHGIKQGVRSVGAGGEKCRAFKKEGTSTIPRRGSMGSQPHERVRNKTAKVPGKGMSHGPCGDMQKGVPREKPGREEPERHGKGEKHETLGS